MLTRRDFTLALATPLLARAQSSALQARIKIDTERTISAIDRKIYGNFAEHLGRCIEGGIFDEGSPLSDSHGYRKDVMAAIKDLHVTQMRWPGGNFASNYHWMDGIGPRDKRPARLEMAWSTIESNRFGTHEFLDYSELMGFEPYVCTNLGTGTWNEAQQWVEYCNQPEGTAMSKLRQSNGRAKPWKVRYWGLGNEVDGPWQMGHKNAEDYGKFALEAAKLMKWTDADVQLIGAGSSNFREGADWIGWNRVVLEYLKDHIDYLSLHMYMVNTANDYYEFLANSLDMDTKIKIAAGAIRASLASSIKHKPIYIAFDEWNVWYRARGGAAGHGRRALEERYNLEDALSVATMLNTFVNNADSVKIANMAQIVNVIAPIFTDEKSLFLQTIYYPLQLFAANAHGTALQSLVNCPSYESKRLGKTVPYLDVSCAYNQGQAIFNVVNRHLDQDVEAEIEAQDKSFSGKFSVATVTGPDIKAENTFGSTKVKTANSTENASGHKLRYRFPPHSFTQIKAQLS